MLEDAPAGVTAGRAAGMAVWAVATTHDPADLGDADRVAGASRSCCRRSARPPPGAEHRRVSPARRTGTIAAVARYGFSLMCEIHRAEELLEQARRAEEAGFDFITISDHIHPWLESHEHSAYAWSVLGALAVQTRRAELVSLVTCPAVRYHPAIVAQKAATVARMSGGRFRLGLGSGENLNEHVVGRLAAPPRRTERPSAATEDGECARPPRVVRSRRGRFSRVEEAPIDYPFWRFYRLHAS